MLTYRHLKARANFSMIFWSRPQSDLSFCRHAQSNNTSLCCQWVLYPLASTELFGFYGRCPAPHFTEIHAATGGEKGHRIGREIMCIIQTWKHNRVRKTQGGYIIMKTTNICLIINFVCSWICCLHTSCLKTILSYTTHWGRVAHMCVSKLNIIGSYNGLSHWSAPSHYLNQCWIIVR